MSVAIPSQLLAQEMISWDDLAGSSKPYPEQRQIIVHPDSLTPVMITHISRHGARFPTTGSCVEEVHTFLMKAYETGQLTSAGSRLLALADSINAIAGGRWGRLDSLGEREQRDIAARMYASAPGLFGKGNRIDALSSWKPRCVMSMYTFLHQLTLLNDEGLDIHTVSGSPQCDTLMRFFETDKSYRELRHSDILTKILESYESTAVNDRVATAILRRLAGREIPANVNERRWTALAVYSMIAGCGAMSIDVDPSQWMTYDEYERCWSCKNLSQYLRYSASDVSGLPAKMATPLLCNIIDGIDRFLSGESSTPVRLMFGHAETLMPLMSLMRIPVAYHPENNLYRVKYYWQNFNIVPMAANITITLFRSHSGRYYARLDVNEQTVPLVPGSANDYPEWPKARRYLMECIQ